MFKKILNAIKEITSTTFKGIGDHGLMTFAASIAFYTIFSLPGLLITIILVSGIFIGQDSVQTELVDRVQGIAGADAKATVESLVNQIDLTGGFTFKTIFGFGTLLFSATTIFISLQEALNRIWDVVPTPEKGFFKFLLNRVLSFGMIISLGFILLISFLLDTLLEVFFNQLETVVGETPAFWLNTSSDMVSVFVTFVVILIIFKILPDVKLRWKDVLLAAAITTGLLLLGKYLIGIYIQSSDFSATYETAGSVIVILVWVYYSTVVLLFGAEITRSILLYRGIPIPPSKGAKKIKIQRMDYEDYKETFSSENNKAEE